MKNHDKKFNSKKYIIRTYCNVVGGLLQHYRGFVYFNYGGSHILRLTKYDMIMRGKKN